MRDYINFNWQEYAQAQQQQQRAQDVAALRRYDAIYQDPNSDDHQREQARRIAWNIAVNQLGIPPHQANQSYPDPSEQRGNAWSMMDNDLAGMFTLLNLGYDPANAALDMVNSIGNEPNEALARMNAIGMIGGASGRPTW